MIHVSQALCTAPVMAEQLVSEAVAAGGLDNVSVVVVQVKGGAAFDGSQTIVAPLNTPGPSTS